MEIASILRAVKPMCGGTDPNQPVNAHLWSTLTTRLRSQQVFCTTPFRTQHEHQRSRSKYDI